MSVITNNNVTQLINTYFKFGRKKKPALIFLYDFLRNIKKQKKLIKSEPN